jgi:hypothetical protein
VQFFSSIYTYIKQKQENGMFLTKYTVEFIIPRT